VEKYAFWTLVEDWVAALPASPVRKAMPLLQGKVERGSVEIR
jgi:hypothetical protein